MQALPAQSTPLRPHQGWVQLAGSCLLKLTVSPGGSLPWRPRAERGFHVDCRMHRGLCVLGWLVAWGRGGQTAALPGWQRPFCTLTRKKGSAECCGMEVTSWATTEATSHAFLSQEAAQRRPGQGPCSCSLGVLPGLGGRVQLRMVTPFICLEGWPDWASPHLFQC